MPYPSELAGPPRRVTARPVASCDTMVVVRPGQVLFAKNSDRDPNEAQFLDWQPRRVHQAGARLRCTWIEVAQVRETHAVLLSRPFWMWGAEIGANEHGVVIGNEAVFTRQRYARTGLTGMDLLRLALERASSAGDAVAVMTELLAQYGQGGGCGHEHRGFTYHNSFIVADSAGGYVLETAGPHWAVEKVESGARSISNGLTIEPFATKYGARLKTAVSACKVRQPLTQRLVADAVGPGELMAALTDHGRGGAEPRYSIVNGAMAAPCMHAGGLAASSQTTASWVAQLRPGAATHWVTATAAPCTSLFKPVAVDAPLDLGPTPSDRYDPAALWWRHERLHRRVLAQPGQLYPMLAAERDAVQARWLAVPPAPADAFAAADALLTGWTAAAAQVSLRDLRPSWVRRYWQTRNTRAGLPPAAPA
jgi:secernin